VRTIDVSFKTLALLRPDLSLPAYLGLPPRWPLAPIYAYFDRTCRERAYPMVFAVTTCRDWRGRQRTYDKHTGTDFVVPVGTPVVAAARGRVLKVGWEPVGGHFLWLDHGAGYATTYHHLSKVHVAAGTPVERGELIARSGASGSAIERFWPWVPPHLHFSLLVDGVPIDPYASETDAETPGFWEGDRPRPNDETAGLDRDLPMDLVSRDDVLDAFRKDPVLGPNFVPPLSEIAPERFSHGPGWRNFTDRPLLKLSLPFRKREVAGIWEG
jgi:murein DD-endopeptidase MepM/ murein hydrolase activator NlpD